MPRDLSNSFWEQATKRAGDDPYMPAVEISHVALSQPLRVVLNDADVVSNGETFVGMYFEVKLPGESDQTAKGELVIQNVSQRIGQVLKSIGSAVDMRLMTMLRSDPDTIEQDYRHFSLRKVKVNALAVSGEIWGRDISGEPCPARRATREATPGLWL